ncbi:hypothetical protein HMPREF1624_01435 [Sporothrix schenckii ATCC 58251]|uniref:tripeptidyl-peptidase II n=1 Tax=Sporothrix schenckii (strain ATCC 58251 / de Perez 2211183) TaxID=1391915 RepID=U7Q7U8_SPOS1|nr:hypothetical protein HMPREF1624_01435 [Sporothrix schenckii ATCC 58251]
MPMRIGFIQADAAVQNAHSMLMDRADPASPLYGQHLTATAVADLFAPADEAVEAVKRWVVESGGVAADRVSLSANRQWLQFDAHVDEAELLLQAKFYSYEHIQSGVNVTACPEYHVPAALQQHIDYITPGTKLASYGFSDGVKALGLRRRENDTDGARLQRRTEQAAATATTKATTAGAPWVTGGCDEFATFECIRAQYGLPVPSSLSKVTPVSGNQLGIFETAGQHYSQDDLDIFFSYTAPEIPDGTKPELRAIDGATGPAATQDTAGAEANMDFEVAMPLVWPQKTVLFQVDDEYYENAMTSGSGKVKGIFNTFFDAIDGSYCTLNAYGQTGNCQDAACIDPVYPNPNGGGQSYQGQLMCGTFKPTNVISISYENAENSLPANYLRRQCLELMKLGLQGVTVVVAAGDNGVGGHAANGGDAHKGCLGSQHDIFAPVSLASCPYALSVGATKLQAAAAASKGTFVEVGPTDFYTGGGFSNIYPTPDWQQSAVATYLGRAKLDFGGYSGDTVQENSGTNFNKSGRAYPDVSALGSNFYMVYRGGLAKGGGTSVAAPVWAAVLTQVNEARLRANKTAVGHVQPVLYKHPEVFTDVVEGSNPGCGTIGFVATAGWDPVSGLGTPIFPKLRDLFLSLA